LRHIQACAQIKGTSQQWAGTLRNMTKKGVTATEIEWSGIIEKLDGHLAASLHRDDVLAILGTDSPCELLLQRHITDTYMPHVRYQKQLRPDHIPATEVRNGRRCVRLLHYADRTFGLCIWLNVDVDVGLFGRNRYWSFSVPRGGKKLAPHPVGPWSRTWPGAFHGRDSSDTSEASTNLPGMYSRVAINTPNG
jgi:hypothetical protein